MKPYGIQTVRLILKLFRLVPKYVLASIAHVNMYLCTTSYLPNSVNDEKLEGLEGLKVWQIW